MHRPIQTLLFLLAIMIASSQIIYSQIGDVINSRIASENIRYAQKGKNFNTKKLALKITKNRHTEFEKAKAIFIWIASNIAYDNELRTNLQLQNSIYTSEKNVLKNVLKRKKALCGGYAFLYQKLCEQVGIESQVIHGYSKKYYKIKKGNNQVDHTWNAVKIGGNWRLLDITLARSQQQNKIINMYWFNTNPVFFIKTHYPENTKWSLLSNPISKSEFERISKR